MKITVIIMLLTTACIYSYAQKLSAISGMVKDSSSSKALENVNVTLKDLKKQVIGSSITGNMGTFNIDALPAADYFINFSCLGFNSRTILVELKKDTHFDMGKVLLVPVIRQLNNINISAPKNLVKQEINRISYNLSADPESKANSLLVMMRKVPFLSVDANDNLLLKGSEDFKVLINGRPSSTFERNLKEVLKSMPASTIERIEVITNPPAKYSAEGAAGIINIITAKAFAGYKATLNTSERLPVGGSYLGSSLIFKKKGLGFSAIGGANLSRNPMTRNHSLRLSEDTSEMLQNGSKKSSGRSAYLGSDISYEINKLNLLTAQLNISGNRTQLFNYQQADFFKESNLLQAFQLQNTGLSNGFSWDAGLNYQLGFKTDKNRLLTWSFLHSYYQNTSENEQDFLQQTGFATPGSWQINKGSTSENTLQADYVQRIKKVMIEAGLKMIFRDNKGDFRTETLNDQNQYEADLSGTNIFNNSQQIVAAYNSFHFAIRQFEIKTGYRAEYATIKASFRSGAHAITKNYLNLLPSLAINRKISANKTMNFAFSHRIKRPGINRLNPFVDRSSPGFETSGNPDLRPALINSFQMGLSSIKKATLNISIDYSFVRNLFLQVSEFYPESSLTRTTYRNTGKASGLNGNIYLQMPLSSRIKMSFNGTSGYNYLQSSSQSFEIFTYNLNTSLACNLSDDWRFNIGLNAISRNITSLQSRSNALFSSSLGISKELLKNKLNFSGSAINPFTKYRKAVIETSGPDFLQNSYSQDYFRNFNISLNYSFGKLREGIKKNKRGIKNDDLSN